MRNLVYYLLWRTEEHTGIVEFFLIFSSVLALFVVSVGFKSFHSGLVASGTLWEGGIGSSMISAGDSEAGFSTNHVSQESALGFKLGMIINNNDYLF